MRCLLLTALFASLTAPAAADLRDVVLSRDGDTVWVQLVFEEQPAGAEIIEENGRLAVAITGTQALPRRFETAGNDVLRGLVLSPLDGQVRADLELGAAWSQARARVEDNRVIVRLSGIADALEAETVPPAMLTTASGEPSTVSAAGEAVPADSPADDSPVAANAAHEAEVADGAPVTLTPDTGVEAEAESALTAAAGASHAACTAADARIADDPWDLDAMIVQAECARSDGNGAEAAELLERVTAMDPERFSALLMLAEIEAEGGSREEARVLYEMAAQVARTDGQAAAAMARLRALQD